MSNFDIKTMFFHIIDDWKDGNRHFDAFELAQSIPDIQQEEGWLIGIIQSLGYQKKFAELHD